MVKIRERQNSYGLLVAVLLIIIMVLIGYIAYGKGLEENKKKNTITTTSKKVIKENINKLYTYEDICNEDDCNKDITTLNNSKIKLESIKEDNIISHNIVITGVIDKTISLKKFVSIEIINNEFIIIEETLVDKGEENNLSLYNKNFIKLDTITINNLLNRISSGLEITYFTYDKNCTENSKSFTKNISLISSDGFNISSSVKGPLKVDGFTC